MIIARKLEDHGLKGLVDESKPHPFSLSTLTESADGLTIKWLDVTDWYGMQRVHLEKGYRGGEARYENVLETVFVLEGGIALSLEDDSGHLRRYEIGPRDGWTVRPGRRFKVEALEDSIAITALTSNLNAQVDVSGISEYITKAGEHRRFPGAISSYLIRKPWGEERWREITDRYVMKEIMMHAGSRSSVHYHEFKRETNFVIAGSAKIILGDNDGRLQEYEFGLGEGWSVTPAQVHRAIAAEDYRSIEVSTIELDDVIRLEDDSGRPSGRITAEHEV